ncbi:MAG: hypothetical protein U1D26_02670 [Patescibacteria group bacterium]|nr:hypothetical protein [bacterium]MDZ4227361.1 hypothetical protein [Patescibacteria group bacterium]
MDEEQSLPVAAGGFLIVVGVLVDGLQLVLAVLYVGIVLNPVISVITWGIFWMTLTHNDIPMMGGKRSFASWLTLISEIIPGVDGLVPGWTAYAIYLTFWDRAAGVITSAIEGTTRGIIGR